MNLNCTSPHFGAITHGQIIRFNNISGNDDQKQAMMDRMYNTHVEPLSRPQGVNSEYTFMLGSPDGTTADVFRLCSDQPKAEDDPEINRFQNFSQTNPEHKRLKAQALRDFINSLTGEKRLTDLFFDANLFRS